MPFSYKPVFIGWITLLAQLPLQLFFTLWAGGFFGGMITALLHPHGSASPAPFLIIGGIVFVTLPACVYLIRKLNYARTEYRFYDDRLEFEEGFFTINKKAIKYKDVKEVNLRKGILQRMYNLGTIYMATTATGSSPYSNSFRAFGFGNISGSGVGVRDIRNPDEAYDKIKALVEKYNV